MLSEYFGIYAVSGVSKKISFVCPGGFILDIFNGNYKI